LILSCGAMSVQAEAPTTDFSGLTREQIEEKRAKLLISTLDDILLGGGREVEWIQRMDILSVCPDIDNINNDLERETAFYKQALASVQEAASRFEALEIPFQRPDDYFAEMVKSDQHMTKVRRQLLHEKKQIEDQVQRRKQREMKKYGKQVQAQKMRERTLQKKKELEVVKKWRKEKKQGVGEEDFSIELLDSEAKEKENARQERQANRIRAKCKRKDEKYGYGGKKRWSKSNTAESSADMALYPRNKKKFIKQRPGAKKRLGKRRRQAGGK